MGCFFALFMSLKLILRRMLPRMLRSGLFLPLGSTSSARSLSVLGLIMGGLDWTLAPALKVRSSRKFSRSAANLRRALSKSKSAGKPSKPMPSPLMPRPMAVPLPFPLPLGLVLRFGSGMGRMVALLRLLRGLLSSMSSSTRPSEKLEIEGASESLETVDRRWTDPWREWRAVAREGVAAELSVVSPASSPSPPSRSASRSASRSSSRSPSPSSTMVSSSWEPGTSSYVMCSSPAIQK